MDIRMDAVIGHTGFVGSNLLRQGAFGAAFNSKTIGSAEGCKFDTVVCAAAPGSMFDANRNPDLDRARVAALQDQLGKLSARTFVLISSIAVLEEFDAGDTEDTEAFQTELAYGRHRRDLEVFCRDTFSNCLIVRLPALLGQGLKKNFLFDLRNPAPTMLMQNAYDEIRMRIPESEGILTDAYAWDAGRELHVIDRKTLARHPSKERFERDILEAGLSATRFTNPHSTFQFYNLDGLWDDIGRGLAAGIGTLHLCPEPVKAADVYRMTLGTEMAENGARLHQEDMRTVHAGLFGRDGHYTADRDAVLADISAFLRTGADQ